MLLGMTASKPHFAILLVDVVIAQTIKTLFQIIWGMQKG